MAKRVGKYPEAFRRMALERMKNCTSVSALADELGVHRTVVPAENSVQIENIALTGSS